MFEAPAIEDFPPRYNIAPAQPVLIARHDMKGAPELVLVRWGLIPSWVKDPRTLSSPLINARAETAADKPSFRGALRHRRCLVPTTGFYEWTGARGAKQPHLVRMTGHEVFALGGVWETWLGADGSEIETMAILTTAASGDVARIHERMPVIITEENFARWLDCRSGMAEGIRDLLEPLPAGRLTIVAVNPKLNNPRAEGADLQEPAIATLF